MSEIDLTSFCIINGSEKNLNTTMIIKILGISYKISVCDEKADDTTTKEIKKAILDRITEIDELKTKIERFGYIVLSKKEYEELVNKPTHKKSNLSKNSNLTPQPITNSRFKPKDGFRIQHAKPNAQPRGDLLIQGFQRTQNQTRQTHSTSAISRVAEDKNYSPDEIQEGLKQAAQYEYKVNQVITGRGGAPVSIPLNSTGEAGESLVEINTDSRILKPDEVNPYRPYGE